MLETFRGRVPERVFDAAYHAPDDRRQRLAARQPGDGARAAGRGRLGRARHGAGQRRRPASRCGSRSCWSARPSSASCCRSCAICSASASTPRVRLVDESQYINRLRDFDFDMISRRLGPDPTRPATSSAIYWGSRGRRHAGQQQLRRHQGPGGRRADRPGDLRARPREPGRPHPRARPRAAVGSSTSFPTGIPASTASSTGTSSRARPMTPRRRHVARATGGSTPDKAARLEARLATADAGEIPQKASPPTPAQAAGQRQWPRRADHRRRRRRPASPSAASSWRRAIARAERRNAMTAYIVRRLLLIVPTLLGIMVINFVDHAVRAGRPGRADHRPAHRHRRRDHRSASPGRRRRHRRRRQRGPTPGRRRAARYRGAQGLDPSSSPSWRSSSASTSRWRALPDDDAATT